MALHSVHTAPTDGQAPQDQQKGGNGRSMAEVASGTPTALGNLAVEGAEDSLVGTCATTHSRKPS